MKPYIQASSEADEEFQNIIKDLIANDTGNIMKPVVLSIVMLLPIIVSLFVKNII